MLQRFLVPRPALGADWTWTVPGEYQATLVSVTAQLSATAQPSTSADQSGNSHTLTYNSGMFTHETFGVAGPFGGSPNLAVDCRNYDSLSNNTLGQTPNAGAFDVATFTWEALVFCANTGNSSQIVGAIDDEGAPTNYRCGFGVTINGGSVQAIASRTDVISFAIGPGGSVWKQIAVTYDGAQWVPYVNGVAGAAVVGHPPTVAQTLKPLHVNGDGVSSQGGNIQIAALAYFSGALAAANLLNHFNAVATSAAAYKTAVNVDTPLAFWMLNDTQTHFQRTAILTLTDGTNVIAKFPGFSPSQQSSLFTWTWSVDGSGVAQTPDQGVTVVPITPTTLPPGYTVGVVTPDKTTFDQWDHIVIWADVVPSSGGPGGIPSADYLNALLVPDYLYRGA
ncbi:MAG TPA: hypothetical protein VFO15_18000 [Xanthobacteraceae bacterium]|nr:hypothetical protein [Xanthobacteraceae bacterium]